MTFDTFKQCLDKIPLHIHIHFSGMSEPWLNPECTRMLLYAHEKGYEMAVYATAVGVRELVILYVGRSKVNDSISFLLTSVMATGLFLKK
jgi:hypothetical protein